MTRKSSRWKRRNARDVNYTEEENGYVTRTIDVS
jgi:hypothetical protein